MKGIFITFEGLDGCGKSTHIDIAEKTLEKHGFRTLRVREPGGTWVGERIRPVLLDRSGHGMDPMAELLLFAAARAQNVQEILLPALQDGQVILCDRYTDSTLAYQGYGRNLDIGLIRQINEIATGGLAPDRTFLFDLTVEEAARRMVGRQEEPDRIDSSDRKFFERVRQGYLDMARSEPDRYRVIDAGGSVVETADRLSIELKEVFSL